MASKIKKAPLGQQVKAALDGRTQRWLAIKIGISEDKMSNKIKGITPFLEEEVDKINAVLNTDFKL